MKLYTENLMMTTLKPSDASLVLEFIIRNRDRLSILEPKRESTYYTKSGQAHLLAQEASALRNGTNLRLWLFPKDKKIIIGSVGLYRIIYGNLCSCMIGYRIDKDYEGKGLMSEAIKEVINYSFAEMDLHRIEAAVMPRNKRSIKLVERCGFIKEGLMNRAVEINGKWEDHFLYAITNNKIKF